jgi:penicillin-binding protein 2
MRSEPGRFPTVQTPAGEAPVVKVLERTARRYPNGALAPHVVGRTSLISAETWEDLLARDAAWTMGEPFSAIGGRYKMDDRLGISGMEKACEEMLRGVRGYVRNHLEFRLLGYEKVSAKTPPQPGLDVYLTIREDFQRAANAALRRAAGEEQLAFGRGALVVVDVEDGSVLAAATWPTYDRETFRTDYGSLSSDERSPLLFRPVQAALPTGSVYKVVTAIAALEEGAITPATTFTCRHRQVFPPGRAFHCTGRHGTIALLTAIEKSCNIYFYNTGLGAGGEARAAWGRRLGLGQPTGVDLPFERAGQMPTPNSTYGVLNLSIGQGSILCTPLQVANAMACIANGGRLNTPHFFDHARDADGKVVRRYDPRRRDLGISPQTLATVREGMERVVRSGTARYAGLDYFRVAGKTGTAELGSGQPNHAWFAGFAPHDDPRIAFAVVSELTPGHGGSHAAPIIGYMLEEVWDAVEQMP